MKVLAIDDQQLILLSVEKKLTELGYEVKTAQSTEEGILLYNSFNPDLVLLDMNMPEMSGKELVSCTGTEVVKYIRVFLKSDTPILVMSGNTSETVIMQNYSLGIDDYMKKPVSLDEMAAKIARVIGSPKLPEEFESTSSTGILQKSCIGVVISCYNAEEQLLSEEFRRFAQKNHGYHLCFVNDGSTDQTLQVLYELQQDNESNVSIYNCKTNRGKAEAVRQGVLHLLKDSQLDYIGYLDVDLSTDFSDFNELVQTIENSEFKLVSGASINATVTKTPSKWMLTNTINLIIQKVVAIPFKYTQHGAKIMDREAARIMFRKSFLTRWLFDVEIFMRMRKYFGKDQVKKFIFEQPLKRWMSEDSPELSMKDSVKIVSQLAQIAFHYK